MDINDILEWRLSALSHLVTPQAAEPKDIFGLAEFIATLALLLVVVMISDFRYRYRLAVHQLNLKKIAFWMGLIVGFLILLIDVWFLNKLPVPAILNNANNLKAIVGVIFLAFVFYLIFVSFVRPAIFGKGKLIGKEANKVGASGEKDPLERNVVTSLRTSKGLHSAKDADVPHLPAGDVT